MAVDHGCVDPKEMKERNSNLELYHQHKVSVMLKMLGLEECAETIVGNERVRGVSGGQRRRTTIGEALLTDARALFLDQVHVSKLPSAAALKLTRGDLQITNGLDAATALDIMASLRLWANTTQVLS